MTVEERARETIDKFYSAAGLLSQVIAQALRDQNEDCAKIADAKENELMNIALKIKRKSRDVANGLAATQCVFAAIACQQTALNIRALAAAPEQEKENEN